MEQTLTQQVAHAIIQNPHFNHRRMNLRMKNRRVVLEGKVASYFEKQMAQETVKSIHGIETVENLLEVEWC